MDEEKFIRTVEEEMGTKTPTKAQMCEAVFGIYLVPPDIEYLVGRRMKRLAKLEAERVKEWLKK